MAGWCYMAPLPTRVLALQTGITLTLLHRVESWFPKKPTQVTGVPIGSEPDSRSSSQHPQVARQGTRNNNRTTIKYLSDNHAQSVATMAGGRRDLLWEPHSSRVDKPLNLSECCSPAPMRTSSLSYGTPVASHSKQTARDGWDIMSTSRRWENTHKPRLGIQQNTKKTTRWGPDSRGRRAASG